MYKKNSNLKNNKENNHTNKHHNNSLFLSPFFPPKVHSYLRIMERMKGNNTNPGQSRAVSKTFVFHFSPLNAEGKRKNNFKFRTPSNCFAVWQQEADLSSETPGPV